MAEEKESKSNPADPQAQSSAPKGDKSPAGAAKAAAKPKKEKPPPIEKKPFTEFMQQHYLPSLEKALKSKGIDDMQLEFEKRKLEIMGAEPTSDEYWQVRGRWKQGQRQFNIAFMKEDISGQKVFSYADNGAKPSTLEQFMGDERRITLDLMVLYTLQRLNGQKWLTRN